MHLHAAQMQPKYIRSKYNKMILHLHPVKKDELDLH